MFLAARPDFSDAPAATTVMPPPAPVPAGHPEPIAFNPSNFLSLGVEVEVQLLDWRTLELCPAAPRLLESLNNDPHFKPELFQSMLEMCTTVCSDLEQVDVELRAAHSRLTAAAEAIGVSVLGVGTHPFDGARREVVVFPADRYKMLAERTRWISTRMAIFGMHVHVGARDAEHAIALINGASPYLAHLLALSASSPFAEGMDTGLASSRATVFESDPTTGTPPKLRSWADFERLVGALRASRSITALKDLWWDIRPNPTFGTVEVRICDGQANLEDTLALVAAVQSLFAWVDQRWQDGEPMAPASGWRLRENKWRAARYGLDTEFLVDDDGQVRRARSEWDNLLQAFDSLSGRLGNRPYLDRLEDLLRRGPSASRQRQVMRETGSLRTVVNWLSQEWKEGPGKQAG